MQTLIGWETKDRGAGQVFHIRKTARKTYCGVVHANRPGTVLVDRGDIPPAAVCQKCETSKTSRRNPAFKAGFFRPTSGYIHAAISEFRNNGGTIREMEPTAGPGTGPFQVRSTYSGPVRVVQ